MACKTHGPVGLTGPTGHKGPPGLPGNILEFFEYGTVGAIHRFDSTRNNLDLSKSVVPALEDIDVLSLCTIKKGRCCTNVQNPNIENVFFLCLGYEPRDTKYLAFITDGEIWRMIVPSRYTTAFYTRDGILLSVADQKIVKEGIEIYTEDDY